VYEWRALLYSFHVHPGTSILLMGFFCSFALSFAVGANDSANSWGTSVGKEKTSTSMNSLISSIIILLSGAGTVSLGWACFLGSIRETLGSTLLSGNVIKKLVAGIINITAYQSNRTEEMLKFEQGQPYLLNENMLLIGK
jgi:phosphate/sulfate permease